MDRFQNPDPELRSGRGRGGGGGGAIYPPDPTIENDGPPPRRRRPSRETRFPPVISAAPSRPLAPAKYNPAMRRHVRQKKKKCSSSCDGGANTYAGSHTNIPRYVVVIIFENDRGTGGREVLHEASRGGNLQWKSRRARTEGRKIHRGYPLVS